MHCLEQLANKFELLVEKHAMRGYEKSGNPDFSTLLEDNAPWWDEAYKVTMDHLKSYGYA